MAGTGETARHANASPSLNFDDEDARILSGLEDKQVMPDFSATLQPGDGMSSIMLSDPISPVNDKDDK